VASEIRDNLHGRGVIEPVKKEQVTYGDIYWNVDVLSSVHKDMKSHTGVVMSLGTGALIAMWTKQKLNTTSSTEDELVGVSDSILNMWATYFFKAQGRGVGDCSRIMSHASSLQTMERHPAVGELDTLIFGTFSFY